MTGRSMVVRAVIFAGAVGVLSTAATSGTHGAERYKLYNVGQTAAWRLNLETGEVAHCALVEHTLVCQEARAADDLRKRNKKGDKTRRQMHEARAQIEELEGHLNRARHRGAELEEELVALRKRCPAPAD